MRDEILKFTSWPGSHKRRIKSQYPAAFEEIMAIEVVPSFKEKLYLWLHPGSRYTCIKCDKPTTLNRVSEGFLTYCSPLCRGRVSPKPKIQTVVPKPSVHPMETQILEISKTVGWNYLGAAVRKRYPDFYAHVCSLEIGKSFNEKLYRFYHPVGQCRQCKKEVSKFKPWGYVPFCSRQCANAYNGKEQTGGYPASYFEQYPDEKTRPATLYLLHIYSDNESFIKIGITARTIKKRRYEICTTAYTVDIVIEREMTLYEAHLKETKIIEAMSDFSYTPKDVKSGHTECFREEAKDALCKMI